MRSAGSGPRPRAGRAAAHPLPRVLCLGDALADLVVRLQAPLAPASDTPARIEPRPGGSAANTAAWLARSGYPLEVHFAGRVGADPFADFHERELLRQGVRPHLARDPARPTGLIVVLLEAGGERSMLTDRGASLALAPSDLPDELFAPGGHLHLSGYVLLDPGPRPAGLEAIRRALARGMSVSVDAASASFLAREGAGGWFAWSAGAALLFANRQEAELLLAAPGGSEPEVLARELAGRYGEAVVKLGAGGAVWAAADGRFLRAPAPRVPAVDTTGAGDAFAAGWLAARLSGGSPEEAMQAALDLAAQAVQTLGARPE
ncbi:MAG: sugar kinase [Bacillota bacterium]|nr:sugar kinase [Bacillota bacterium]